jgi:hypothetical protein
MFFGGRKARELRHQTIVKGADREHEYRGTNRGVTSRATVTKVMVANTGKTISTPTIKTSEHHA